MWTWSARRRIERWESDEHASVEPPASGTTWFRTTPRARLIEPDGLGPPQRSPHRL